MPDVLNRTRGDSGARARPLITATSCFQPEDRALRIWIDATMPGSEIRVFGMTLLERLLRALTQTGASPSEVRVELAAGAPIPASLPRTLIETLPLHWSREDLPLAERFERAVQAAEGDPVLALSADTVVDTRPDPIPDTGTDPVCDPCYVSGTYHTGCTFPGR